MNIIERTARQVHESRDLRDPDRDGRAVVEVLNRGTRTGPLYASLGEFLPTGRRMDVRSCPVMREQDGKVVEGRDRYDSASIARHLGLVA